MTYNNIYCKKNNYMNNQMICKINNLTYKKN